MIGYELHISKRLNEFRGGFSGYWKVVRIVSALVELYEMDMKGQVGRNTIGRISGIHIWMFSCVDVACGFSDGCEISERLVSEVLGSLVRVPV
jgi:hypothetical protein